MSVNSWVVNLRLVHLVLNRSGSYNIEYDDAVQEACFALVKAAQTYDPSLGAWSSYAVKAVRMCLAKVCKYRRNRYLPSADLSGSQAPKTNTDLRLDLTEALSKLPESDSELLRKVYMDGWSYDELAELHGLRRRCLHQRSRVARKKLSLLLEVYR